MRCSCSGSVSGWVADAGFGDGFVDGFVDSDVVVVVVVERDASSSSFIHLPRNPSAHSTHPGRQGGQSMKSVEAMFGLLHIYVKEAIIRTHVL